MYNWLGRKALRLKDYNYSNNWYYFVTIWTKSRQDFFGEIINWKMILNEYGRIVKNEIFQTENIRKEIFIDEFIIMPNHIHLIIIIKNESSNPVGNAGLHSLQTNQTTNKTINQNTINNITKNKLSNTIQAIKSSVTKNIRNNHNDYIFWWHKSFYDVIIRNVEQLKKSREYIINNPSKWEEDINNIL